ncbi:hypothetical protein RUM43_009266 [Polyplax serrata]|uniref:alkaline phosphatase n=1 Tax=Polyplax serrata TaxID=468196 RepID=A0AAN8PW43_POLSC
MKYIAGKLLMIQFWQTSLNVLAITCRTDGIYDFFDLWRLEKNGKMTGIVTNTRVTHATPAALYAHTPSRYWEDDGKIPPASRKSCKDIARQLIEDDPGRNINVSFIFKTFQRDLNQP